MLSPCWEEVVDINAPVATNKILLRFPVFMSFNNLEHNTEAEHPHPEPAAPHLADPLATAAAPHLRFRTASMKRQRLPLLPMKR